MATAPIPTERSPTEMSRKIEMAAMATLTGWPVAIPSALWASRIALPVTAAVMPSGKSICARCASISAVSLKMSDEPTSPVRTITFDRP